jgi:hypothetical protein
MGTAIILRCRRKHSDGEVRVWYEYAPIVEGRAKRRPNHMMASAESAADLARRSGFSVEGGVVDVQV